APRWTHRVHRGAVRVLSSRDRLCAVDAEGGVSLAPWRDAARTRRALSHESAVYLAASPLREEVWLGAGYRGQGTLLRVAGGAQPGGFDEAGRSVVRQPTGLTLSVDGELLALGHGERTSLYRAEAVLEGGFGFSELAWLKQPTVPVAQAFLADGSAFASVTGEGTLERLDSLSVLDLTSYEIVGSADLPVVPTCMLGLADGRLILGTRRGHLLLFDGRAKFLGALVDPQLPARAPGTATTVADVYEGRANDGPLHGLALSPAGLLYAVGEGGPGARSTIRVWDLARGALVREQQAARRYGSCCLSADGRYLACGDADGAIDVWDRWLPDEWAP
ncbi:MAG: hypothetical protein KDD82_04010, partial [Planctomycetes bacterium]|nr:hypothetical protein [Planctomycetota bacterium]